MKNNALKVTYMALAVVELLLLFEIAYLAYVFGPQALFAIIWLGLVFLVLNCYLCCY